MADSLKTRPSPYVLPRRILFRSAVLGKIWDQMIWNHFLNCNFDLKSFLWQVILISNQFSGDFLLILPGKKQNQRMTNLFIPETVQTVFTSLTSSAAVERLLTVQRCWAHCYFSTIRNDSTFEKLLMLKANQFEWLWRITNMEHISLQFWMLCHFYRATLLRKRDLCSGPASVRLSLRRVRAFYPHGWRYRQTSLSAR